MAASNFELKGGKALQSALLQLAEGVRARHLRAAVAAGANPIRQAAKQNAQALGLKQTGALIANIARKHEKVIQPDYREIAIGVRSGQRRDVKRRLAKRGASAEQISATLATTGDPFYWRFAEFGTRHQPATPFLRPAFEAQKENALQKLKERLQRGLEEEAKKAKSRA